MNIRGEGLLVGSGLEGIFDRTSESNRDGIAEPYLLLQERLRHEGIALHAAPPGHSSESQVLFELHMNVQTALTQAPSYLLLWETPHVVPANGNPANFQKYRKVFTWRDDLAGTSPFIKLNFPNALRQHAVDGWASRDRFCCVIASNKSVAKDDGRELYSERVKTIQWFEKHAPGELDLYGPGWDVPGRRPGFKGKLMAAWQRKLLPLMNHQAFPSYCGTVARKQDVLRKTRFSICYENVGDFPGYITEKIFDCFFSGCIPVYWGAPNITDYIPQNCFIDRRQFKDHAALYSFLHSMTESTFMAYQQRMADFLASAQAVPFSAPFFAERVATTLLNDAVNG